MKKLLSILVVSLFFSGSATSEIINFYKCSSSKDPTTDNFYDEHSYKIDLINKSVIEKKIVSDYEWEIMSENARQIISKISIDEYPIQILDTDFVVVNQSYKTSKGLTYFKYTFDLKKKIIQKQYISYDERKSVYFYQCL